jgi:hypothetical protein
MLHDCYLTLNMIEYQPYTDEPFLEECLPLMRIDKKRQVTKCTMQHYINYT